MARMLGVLNAYDHYCYRCGNGLKRKTRRAQRQTEKQRWRRELER